MTKLNSYCKHLKPGKIYLAEKVAFERIKLARQVVVDRAEKDAEFAKDVLKAVGDKLSPEAKAICEKSVADAKTKELAEKWEKTGLLDVPGSANSNMAVIIESQERTPIEIPSNEDINLGDGFIATQSDGGGMVIVPETYFPDFPRDGEVV